MRVYVIFIGKPALVDITGGCQYVRDKKAGEGKKRMDVYLKRFR
jgi:hypothetical protein